MTEFASKHEMARLIGSPPGYVGYEEGGQLTSKLSKCPDAVVLLDEVEKVSPAPHRHSATSASLVCRPLSLAVVCCVLQAHPDVLTLMLQVFDEGRLTDGKGKTIHCPNAIFIMTSNLVQEEIRDAIREGKYQLRPDMHTGHSSGNKQHTSEQQAHRSRLLNNLRGVGGLADATSSNDSVHHASGQQQQQQQVSGSSGPGRASSQTAAPSVVSVSSSSPTAPTVAATDGTVSVPNTVETIVPAPTTASDIDPAAISLVAKSTDDFLRYQIHPILKRHFRREEFLGRINDIVVFHPLLDKDLAETVETELGRWKVKAYERHQIVLKWSERLVEALKSGYDERYGERQADYTAQWREWRSILTSSLVLHAVSPCVRLPLHDIHCGEESSEPARSGPRARLDRARQRGGAGRNGAADRRRCQAAAPDGSHQVSHAAG